MGKWLLLVVVLAGPLSTHLVAQCTNYDIVVGGGSATDEIHWELVDEFGVTVAQGDAPENTGECLPDGCYTMYMYDDGGDGWNGGDFTIVFENTTNVVASGTLNSGGFGTMQVDLGGGCGSGICSDHQIVVTAGSFPADIYWEIYDQFGTFLIGGGAPENTVICLEDGCYSLYLYDFGGDGWNGATYTITNVATTLVEATGTLAGGSYAQMQLILGAGCGLCDPYTMNVTAGNFPADVTWELYDASFNLIASGGAPASVALCLPIDCYTLYMYDAFGNGWNGALYSFVDGSNATVASGTLATGSFGTAQVSIGGGCSSGTCSTFTMTVTGGSAPADVSWSFASMGLNYAAGGAPMSVQMCLDTGCYVMQMYDAVGNGWNGANWTLTNSVGAPVANGTLATGTSGAVAVPLGNGPCDVPQVITASDCPQAVNVCTDLNFTIDPNGWGAIWEIPTLGSTSNPEFNWGDALLSPWGTDHYGCLMGQEINTTWMIVNISGSGSLEFTLGANGSQTGFYDWTMFPYDASTCSAILSNTVSPVRCNWNFASYGGTGIVGTVPSGGVPENFEPPLNVIAGQRYLICFSNWSSVTTVVPLVFGGTATVSCDPVMLPVQLLSFNAEVAPWSIELSWATGSERNTSHFNVERSHDMWMWETSGRVTAVGNSTIEQHYQFSDRAPWEGISYYRLSVVDVDGSVKTSPIIRAEWKAPVLHCWPSPNEGSFLVDLGAHVESAEIAVLDQYGRMVPFERSKEGDDELRILLTGVGGGIYTVRATEGSWIRTGRVTVEPH